MFSTGLEAAPLRTFRVLGGCRTRMYKGQNFVFSRVNLNPEPSTYALSAADHHAWAGAGFSDICRTAL
jgi:hypothetical protein